MQNCTAESLRQALGGCTALEDVVQASDEKAQSRVGSASVGKDGGTGVGAQDSRRLLGFNISLSHL